MSITGVSYLILTIGLGFFSLEFFRSWKKTKKETGKDIIGKLLFLFLLSFAFISLFASIGGIFFAKNPLILKLILILTNFLLIAGSVAAVYLISYLRPIEINLSVWLVLILFLGASSVIYTTYLNPQPFLEVSGKINWNIDIYAGLLRFSLYLVTFPFLAMIFMRQFQMSRNLDTRIKSFGMYFIFLFGLSISFIDFVLEPIFYPSIISDIFVGILGIILIISFFAPRFQKLFLVYESKDI